MSDKLKPCPFCGGTTLSIVRQTEDREGWPVALRCEDCGCDGPWIYTREKAAFTSTFVCAEMTGWNRRVGDEKVRWVAGGPLESAEPIDPDGWEQVKTVINERIAEAKRESQADLAEAVRLLRDYEWKGWANSGAMCISCDEPIQHGHNKSCVLTDFLARMKKERGL